MNIYTLRAAQVTATAKIKITHARVHAVSETSARKLARIGYDIPAHRWRVKSIGHSLSTREYVADPLESIE